ncbi:hypothetical protein Avbf_01681 [Armadillidium vulgare]|nr:hypothetical protein Avbf_01681 [Armadillidium vulgare]
MTKMDNFYTQMFNTLKTQSQEEHSKILSEVEGRIEVAQKLRIDDLETRLTNTIIDRNLETQREIYKLEKAFSSELHSKIDEKLKMKTTNFDGLKQMLFLALKNSIKEMENKIEEKFNEVSIPDKEDFAKQIEILYEDCRKRCNSAIQDKIQKEVSSISSEIKSLRDAQKSIVSNMETTQHQFKDQIDIKIGFMFLELSNSISDMKKQIKTIDIKVNTKILDLIKYSSKVNQDRLRAMVTTSIKDMQRNKKEKDLAEFLMKEEERMKEVTESSTKQKPHFRIGEFSTVHITSKSTLYLNLDLKGRWRGKLKSTLYLDHIGRCVYDEDILFEDLKKKEKELKELRQMLDGRMKELAKEVSKVSKKQIPPSSSRQISDSVNSFENNPSCSKPYFLNLIGGKNLYSPIHDINPEHTRNLGNTNKNDQEQVKAEENNEELENEDNEDDDSFTCSELSEDDEYSDTDSVTSDEREDKPFDYCKCDLDYLDSKSDSVSGSGNDENDDDNGDDDSCKVEKENKEKRSNNKDNEEQVGVDEEKEESANEDNKGDNSFNCSEFSEDDGSNSDSKSEDKLFCDNKCDDRIEKPIEMAEHQTENMVNENPLGNVESTENFGVLTMENEQLYAERILSNLKPSQPILPTPEELMKELLSLADINAQANQLIYEAYQRDHLIPEQPSDPVLSDSDESFDGEIIKDCDVPSLPYVTS